MDTSSCSCFTPIDLCSNKITYVNLHKNGGNCSFLGRKTNLQHLDLIVRGIASPEAAADLVSSSAGGDLLSSFSLPTVPGLSNSPWVAGIVGLAVGVPFLIQWLLRLTKEVDLAAEMAEKIADSVGKVAEEVDKAADDLVEALPEGGLKQVVNYVEDLAEETTKEAQKVEDLMNKVEELDEKLEQLLEKESKGTEKE
ncbi:hypothetical protein C2S51_030370 [Perilla frutescens var. frutescens]|nr:hypothetical protein C2S51_030370 [Perilla frutescens var. frutescens]